MSGSEIENRQVFVAYAYGLYSKDDYRKVFSELSEKYSVQFIFADEKITNMHIMNKIESYIRSAKFSIFDISGWNPNVTLELGFAMAVTKNWYISFNPKHTDLGDVPSDIKGIDRIQYSSFSEYTGKLLALMEQSFPKQNRRPSINDYLSQAQDNLLIVLRSNPGLKMNDISKILDLDPRLTKVVIASLMEKTLIRSTGATKGTQYYLVD